MKSSTFLATFLLSACAAQSAITLTGPSTDWISLGGNYDYFVDQQTGQSDSDIVGSVTDPGFFTSFDDLGTSSLTDGELGFRIRFDENGKQGNTTAFSTNLWVGIDGNQDGKIDIFLGINTQGGGADSIEIRNAGSGLNVSPSTTSISSTAETTYTATALNYHYRAVNFLTDGGTTNDLTTGGTDTDYYLSFLVRFQDVVSALEAQGIDIDETSALQYVIATSTQINSLNQDIGGIDGNDRTLDMADTWGDLGGTTAPRTASGILIPEPSVFALLTGALLFCGASRRRR